MVVAALVTVVLASRYADDLVADDYYRDGLAINKRLQRERAATQRGMEARFTILERRLQIRLNGIEQMDELRLALYHPVEANRDFSLTLDASAPGFYLASLPAAVAPNWQWSLDAGDGSDWRLSGDLQGARFLRGDP